MTLTREELCNRVGEIRPDKSKPKEWVKPLWFLFSIGWYVALSVAIPTGIGFWLDRPDNFDTHPLYTLIGFGLGTIIAFYGLYRMLRRFYLEQKAQEKNQEPEQHQ